MKINSGYTAQEKFATLLSIAVHNLCAIISDTACGIQNMDAHLLIKFQSMGIHIPKCSASKFCCYG